MGNFSFHNPGFEFRNLDQLWEYVSNRTERIDKNYAEVIDLGVTGYSIAKPVINEIRGGFLPIDLHALKAMKEPAMLIEERGFIRDKGTVSDLKRRASQRVLQERFSTDYYIVGKNIDNILMVTGEGKWLITLQGRVLLLL